MTHYVPQIAMIVAVVIVFGTPAAMPAPQSGGPVLAADTSEASNPTDDVIRQSPTVLLEAIRTLLARAPPAVAIVGRGGNGDDPLDNDIRATIYEAVVGSPASTLAAIAGATGIAGSTARYHVRVLQDEGLLESAMIRGKYRFYPAGTDREAVVIEAALDDSATALLLEAVVRAGPVAVTELAELVERSPSTVAYHLKRLDDAGLIERERRGRCVVARATPAISSRLSDEGFRPNDDGGRSKGG